VVTPFQPFDLEHWQSEHEQTVAHNLADSSITGVSLGDLVGPDVDADVERLLAPAAIIPTLKALAGNFTHRVRTSHKARPV